MTHFIKSERTVVFFPLRVFVFPLMLLICSTMLFPLVFLIKLIKDENHFEFPDILYWLIIYAFALLGCLFLSRYKITFDIQSQKIYFRFFFKNVFKFSFDDINHIVAVRSQTTKQIVSYRITAHTNPFARGHTLLRYNYLSEEVKKKFMQEILPFVSSMISAAQNTQQHFEPALNPSKLRFFKRKGTTYVLNFSNFLSSILFLIFCIVTTSLLCLYVPIRLDTIYCFLVPVVFFVGFIATITHRITFDLVNKGVRSSLFGFYISQRYFLKDFNDWKTSESYLYSLYFSSELKMLFKDGGDLTIATFRNAKRIPELIREINFIVSTYCSDV